MSGCQVVLTVDVYITGDHSVYILLFSSALPCCRPCDLARHAVCTSDKTLHVPDCASLTPLLRLQFIEKMAEKAMGRGQQNQGGPPGGYQRPQEVRGVAFHVAVAAALRPGSRP